MTVRDWPAYVLHRRGGLPEEIRAQLSAEASERELSLGEMLRRILCAHFRLDCTPVLRGKHKRFHPIYEPGRDAGARAMLVRMQPELFAAIQQEADESERTMRSVIVEALESHYERKAVA